MVTVEQIRDLKQHYVDDLYSEVRKEQKTDQTYRDDTFPVPEVKDPHKVSRSGIGSRMVDAPAENIITSNPQAFISTGNKDVARRLSEQANEWLQILRKQNPNPFKESVKNKLGRGENLIKLSHNERWVVDPIIRKGLPVFFFVPDPMNIYASPEEDENGVPERVIVFYERQPREVIQGYPDWKNPRGIGKNANDSARVQWFEYWDEEARYFEADGDPVLGGIQENIYRLVPFVRRYSGFGRRSPEGKLEDLIVSDLRFSRDLIKEELILRSDLASVIHIFAHRPLSFTIPQGSKINADEIAQELSLGAYDLNFIELPEGSVKVEWDVNVPPQEAFQHWANIKAEINQRSPFIMSGFPLGASGRQQDMSELAAMRRYDTIVENTETAFATAIKMAFKICKQVPTLKPDKLHEEDLDAEFDVEVKLKAADPIEEDRKATLGSRLWNGGNGEIDLRTNLVQYQNKTAEEAEDIIANMLVDKLTLYNPDVAEVMGMVFAEESGMDRWIEEAQKRRMVREEQQKALQNAPTKTGTERSQGEVKTGLGREMMDMSLENKGGRSPPSRFTRGG